MKQLAKRDVVMILLTLVALVYGFRAKQTKQVFIPMPVPAPKPDPDIRLRKEIVGVWAKDGFNSKGEKTSTFYYTFTSDGGFEYRIALDGVSGLMAEVGDAWMKDMTGMRGGAVTGTWSISNGFLIERIAPNNTFLVAAKVAGSKFSDTSHRTISIDKNVLKIGNESFGRVGQ